MKPKKAYQKVLLFFQQPEGTVILYHWKAVYEEDSKRGVKRAYLTDQMLPMSYELPKNERRDCFKGVNDYDSKRKYFIFIPLFFWHGQKVLAWGRPLAKKSVDRRKFWILKTKSNPKNDNKKKREKKKKINFDTMRRSALSYSFIYIVSFY